VQLPSVAVGEPAKFFSIVAVIPAVLPANAERSAEQAAEYERLFAEREMPRWLEYKQRCTFISARIFRAAFGADRREDTAKVVIAGEVPSHAEHSQHDADPGSRSLIGSPARSSQRIRLCTAGRCCTLSDRHSASASAPGCRNADDPEPTGSSTPSRVPDDDPERLLMKRAGNGHGGHALGAGYRARGKNEMPICEGSACRLFR
jgi:hypothetical protein